MTNVQSFAKLNCNLKTLYCTYNKKVRCLFNKGLVCCSCCCCRTGSVAPSALRPVECRHVQTGYELYHLTVTICYSWCPISISLKPLIHSLVSIPTHLMLSIVLLLTVQSTVNHFQSTIQTYPTFLFMILAGCLHCLCFT